MNPIHMHHDERIFPGSYIFKPERWLQVGGTADEKMRQHKVAFLRGTRGCSGINLAYRELYLILSMVFRKFGMELWETDDSVVTLAADIPLPKWKNKNGVRGLVNSFEG